MNAKLLQIIASMFLLLALAGCGGSDSNAAPLDSDRDGVPDTSDAFPRDPTETSNRDGDAVGDNADVFPDDPTEWADQDNDGIGDNSDAFPYDPNETTDSDGDSVGDNSDAFPNDPTEWYDSDGDGIGDNQDNSSGSTGDCETSDNGINWDALMNHNCSRLSDYNLFKNAQDPTTEPNENGVLYEISTALFTDYASKYRFIFLPENTKMKYTQSEVFNFPVGTVITKTFAMPADTSERDGQETIIETRLLIHRTEGWVALPYYWADETDAILAIAGKRVDNMQVTHKGNDLEFTYVVPKAASCTSCHAKSDSDDAQIIPIGPKARFLNMDHEYASGIQNQLSYLADNGLLEGLPDFADVENPMAFNDELDVSALEDAQVTDLAKAYLDVNCAHCHRQDGAGAAGASGLQLEYQRAIADDVTKFGICKVPVAGGHQNYTYDIVPGNPEESYLLFRVNTTDPRHKMPELGRATIHQEGVDLVREWIARMNYAACQG